MNKHYRDHNNTVDSVEWRHKGCSVTLNSHPCSHPAEGNSVWTERYNVYDRSDTFIGRTATLTEAAELIAQEVGHG